MKNCCETWLKEQFGDDPETIAAVYAEYAETMAQQLRQLSEVRASGDAAAIDRVLHTIKGTSAMVGDAELSALAAAARSLKTAAELDEAEERIRALASQI